MQPDRNNIQHGLLNFKNIVIQSIGKNLTIALDLETTSLDTINAEITWLSWATNSHFGVIPIAHRNSHWKNDDEVALKEDFERLWKSNATLVFHNAAYDLAVLSRRGWIDLDEGHAEVHDIMIMSYLLNPVKSKEGGKHKLKTLYDEYLRDADEGPQPDFRSTSGNLDFCDVTYEDASYYSAFDAWSTIHIHKILLEQITQDPDLLRYFIDIESKHVFSTIEIAQTGVYVAANPDCGLPGTEELDEELEKLENLIYSKAGKRFNLSSPAQVSRNLFLGKHGIVSPGKSRSGSGFDTSGSTLEAVLSKEKRLKNRILIALVILRRDLAEKRSKISSFLDSVHSWSEKAHPQMMPLTSTGRFLTRGANFLALSSSTGIKGYLRPHQDWRILRADFSQIDFRVIANETGSLNPDSSMASAVNSGIDLHLRTLMLGNPSIKNLKIKKIAKHFDEPIGFLSMTDEIIPYDETFMKPIIEGRQKLAKRLNFGVSYGIGSDGILKELNSNDALSEVIRTLPLNDIEKDEASDRLESWSENVNGATLEHKEYTLDEVQDFLDLFHNEYPDISSVQKKIEKEMQMNFGISSNMFGRRCRVAGISHLKRGWLDVEVRPESFFRCKVRSISFDKKRIFCIVEKVYRLKVEQPNSRQKKSKFTDLDRTTVGCLFDFSPAHLDLWDTSELDTRCARESIQELADFADYGCNEFFHPLRTGPVHDLFANDDSDYNDGEAVEYLYPPFAFIPHTLIRSISSEDQTLEVDYLGYASAKRKFVSYHMQSTSMDFTKIAMSEFRQRRNIRWPDPNVRPRLVNCIHDEIAIVSRKEDAEEAAAMLKNCMEDLSVFRPYLAKGRELVVKIEAEVGIGDTYETAKP